MRDLTTTLVTVIFNDGCELDDAVVEDFIEKNKATNTVRKTKSDLNVWYRWCAGVNESRKLEELTPSELNHLMSHFFYLCEKEKWRRV